MMNSPCAGIWSGSSAAAAGRCWMTGRQGANSRADGTPIKSPTSVHLADGSWETTMRGLPATALLDVRADDAQCVTPMRAESRHRHVVGQGSALRFVVPLPALRRVSSVHRPGIGVVCPGSGIWRRVESGCRFRISMSVNLIAPPSLGSATRGDRRSARRVRPGQEGAGHLRGRLRFARWRANAARPVPPFLARIA
jgi:hypothetical protein